MGRSLRSACRLTARLAVLPGLLLACVASATPALAATKISTGTLVSGQGKCLADPADSASPGTVVRIGSCGGSLGQLWTVEKDNTIRVNDRCLDTKGDFTTEQTPVTIDTCDTDSGNTQKWIFESNGTLRNEGAALCLGIKTGASTIWIRKCDSSAASQRWSPPTPAGGDAATGVAALHEFYNSGDGLFCANPRTDSQCWWETPNELIAIINYQAQTGSGAYRSDVTSSLATASAPRQTADCKNTQRKGEDYCRFVDYYYDDDAWWALALLDAYDAEPAGAKTAAYLTDAYGIYGYVKTHGLDGRCGGGVWQFTDPDAAAEAAETGPDSDSDMPPTKNAIANELYLTLAARLYLEDKSRASYLADARTQWSWFQARGFLDPVSYSSGGTQRQGYLVRGGLDASCAMRGSQFWTYDEGQLIGGLYDLSRADPVHGAADLQVARDIANCVTSTSCGGDSQYARPPVDVGGILTEPCERLDCGAPAGTYAYELQFKAVLMRNLYCLDQATGHAYHTFTSQNASAVFANDQSTAVLASPNDFGLWWGTPRSGTPGSPGSSTNPVNEAADGSALALFDANISGQVAPAPC